MRSIEETWGVEQHTYPNVSHMSYTTRILIKYRQQYGCNRQCFCSCLDAPLMRPPLSHSVLVEAGLGLRGQYVSARTRDMLHLHPHPPTQRPGAYVSQHICFVPHATDQSASLSGELRVHTHMGWVLLAESRN